jgi:bifunctional DNase/RNase
MSQGEKAIISMRILGLIFDPNLNTTVVVLLDATQERVLPIWIGPMEGNAIAIGMEKVDTPRPMTHDLMKNLLDEFKVQVKKVVVTELKEDTFYAMIHLNVDGKELKIDSRPSDAIALAVRVEAPIFCAQQVMEAAADLGLLKQRSDFDESEDLQKWLEGLKADDFGKYKM